jgi:hypothetical protein
MSEQAPERFEAWAVVELLGHRRLAGRVTEQTIAGSGFLRIDIPGEGDVFQQTHLVNPSSIYAITRVSEETARVAALASVPEPISVWQLPQHIQDAVRHVKAPDALPF